MKDKNVDALNWVKWLWSLSPTGWVISAGVVVDTIISLSLGTWCSCGSAVISFILSFIFVGFMLLMLLVASGVIATIVIAAIDAWPRFKEYVKKWWASKPK